MGHHSRPEDSPPQSAKYKGHEGQVERSTHRQATDNHNLNGHDIWDDHGLGHGERGAQRGYSKSPTSLCDTLQGSCSLITFTSVSLVEGGGPEGDA